MKVLVTGGAGYVGAPVVQRLLNAGHVVRVLDLVPQDETPFRGNPSVHFVVGDLREPAVQARALKGIEAVIHLAAVVIVRPLKDDAERHLLRSVNQDATASLVQVAREAGVRRFVFASTCSVYEPTDPGAPATEESPTKATNEYTEGKLAAERAVLETGDARFEPVVLRLATVYGASQRLNFEPLPNSWIREALKTKRLEVYGPGSWRPYVHTRDVAQAVQCAVEAPGPVVTGQIFNVGSDDQNLQKKRIAEEVQRLVPTLTIHINEGKSDPRDYFVSFSKARERLGFRPVENIAEGLAELESIIRQNHLV